MLYLRLFKSPLFVIGFLFVVSLLTLSFYFSFNVEKGSLDAPSFMTDENGDLVDTAPYAPSVHPPLGTDRRGQDMFYKIVDGAKYTIGIAFVISALRILFSTILGVIYGTYLMRFQKYVDGLIDGFHYIPVALIAFIFLLPVSYGRYTLPIEANGVLIYQIIVLTFIAVPTLTALVGKETEQILKNEFIVGAEVLGASKLRILWKHVRPYLSTKLLIHFGQQIVQTLIVFAHLGLLKIFIGGIEMVLVEVNQPATAISISNEWSGLIAFYFRELKTNGPWIILSPLLAFSFTVLAFNFMIDALKNAASFNTKTSWKYSFRRKRKQEQYTEEKQMSKELFQFVSK
jgi:peptide/nickel transport system permease protein